MIVCNTSPLIALAILDKVDLLSSLYGEWLVPTRAATESTVDGKPFSERLDTKLQGHVVDLGQNAVVETLSIVLDRGEAEVIALAESRSCRLVLMDDRKGRRICGLRGLQVVGTVGLLLQAKRNGLISDIRPLLDQLITARIRLRRELYVKALEMAGEL